MSHFSEIMVYSFLLGFVFGALVMGVMAGFLRRATDLEIRASHHVRETDEHARDYDDRT